MWSNGYIPFSGGTGRSPLLPPNAPHVTRGVKIAKALPEYVSFATGRL